MTSNIFSFLFRKKFKAPPFTTDLTTQLKWREEFEEFLWKNDLIDSPITLEIKSEQK